MASFRDQLIPAAFRGVPFKVTDHRRSGGRRIAGHDFINGDEPYIEDTGRRTRTFQMQAFVLGDDYMTQRDQLIDACELAGPGLLDHPYFGQLTVFVVGYSQRETKRSERWSTFTLDFTEAGALAIASDSPDVVGGADAAAEAAGDVAEADSVSGFDQVLQAPQVAIETLTSAVASVAATVKSLDFISPIIQDLDALASAIDELANNAVELISAPANLASKVREVVDGVFDAVGNVPGRVLAAYETLIAVEFGVGSISTSAHTDFAITAATSALDSQVRLHALGGAIRAAARVEWETLEQALQARNRLAADLDALLLKASGGQFQVIEQLRRSLLEAVPPRNRQLPRLETITTQGPEPSLVVAYRATGSVVSAREFVNRNRFPTPARVSAGTVEVVVP